MIKEFIDSIMAREPKVAPPEQTPVLSTVQQLLLATEKHQNALARLQSLEDELKAKEHILTTPQYLDLKGSINQQRLTVEHLAKRKDAIEATFGEEENKRLAEEKARIVAEKKAQLASAINESTAKIGALKQAQIDAAVAVHLENEKRNKLLFELGQVKQQNGEITTCH